MDSSKESLSNSEAWVPQTESLLNDWRNRAYACQVAYFLSSTKSRRYYIYLGVPTVVCSAIVGTALFTDYVGGEESIWWLRYIAGLVSITAAVLSALQTFFKFSEAAGRAAVAGELYASIRREIESELALPIELRADAKQFVNSIRTRMDDAGEKTPEISEREWRKIAALHSVKEPGAGSKSNYVSEEAGSSL